MNRSHFPSFLGIGSDPCAGRARDRRVMLGLFLLAVILYFPGIFWGLPEAVGPGREEGMADDEVGALGPLTQVYSVISGRGQGAPMWPLCHYLVVGAFQIPYLVFQLAIGALADPRLVYPYGFQDPVASIKMLAVIARMVSVLMGAGIVVAAYSIARTVWDRTAGVVSALFVLLMYSMFYYPRTSNVDVPALFWSSLVLVQFARFLQERSLTVWRAGWIGLLTAAAVATKDQNFAVLALLPLAILPLHLQSQRETGLRDIVSTWKAPLLGGLIAVAAYAVLSGLALRPAMYFHHLRYITTPGMTTNFYRRPPGFSTYAELVRDGFTHLVHNHIDWLVVVAALAGIVLSWSAGRRNLALLLPIPSLYLFGLVPVRYVAPRYVMPWALVLACFAGYAITQALRSPRRWIRVAALVALLASCSLSLLRGAELTYLLYRDSRWRASQWLDVHTTSSDRIEYFGWRRRILAMPRSHTGAHWFLSNVGPAPGSGAIQGEFVLLLGLVDGVSADSRLITASPGTPEREGCPDWVRAGLETGSLGYKLAARFLRPTFFRHAHYSFNPPIEIYVRQDRAGHLPRGVGSP